jgi:Cytochrome c554 and c-prime
MKRFTWFGLAIIALACVTMLVGNHLSARAEEEAQLGYVGVGKCKMCHKSAKKGNQFGHWEAGPHAHAYKTLLTEESKVICAKMEIKVAPNEAPECLKCHVTGHGVKAELLGKKYSIEDGVGCESCHGPGADYLKIHKKDPAGAKAAGMVDPTDAEMCKRCHNPESPTYKEFVYEEKMKVAAHPNPLKK